MQDQGDQPQSRDRLRRCALGRVSLAVCAAILVFYFSVLLSSAVLFALRLGLNRIPLIVGLVSALGILPLVCRLDDGTRWFRRTVLSLLILVAICAGSAIMSLLVYDQTYDGQLYHQETVIQLARGWNPLRGDLDVRAVPSDEARPHINGLARGAEVAAAAVYVWSDSIELGKLCNAMLIAAAFFAALAALLSFEAISIARAILISLILALNPVSICQTFSFYVDGQLAALLLCLSAFLALFIRTGQRRYATMAMMTVAMLLSVKSTAAAFAPIYVAAALLWLMCQRQRGRALDALLAGVAGAVIGIFISLSPYMTNTLRHGHPLYPFRGPQSFGYDWRRTRPADFNEMNRFERLFRSIASMPDDDYAGGHFAPSRLTAPMFFWPPRRLGWFAYPDVRVGGFGPFFSGALVLGVVAIALTRRREAVAAVALVVAVLLSVVIHPECWWARFCPQLYAMPTVLVIAATISPSKAAGRAALAATVVLWLNALFVAGSYIVAQVHWNGALRRQLAELRGSPRPILIDFSDFRSHRVRLSEAGVKFLEVPPAGALVSGPICMSFGAGCLSPTIRVGCSIGPRLAPAEPLRGSPRAVFYRQ